MRVPEFFEDVCRDALRLAFIRHELAVRNAIVVVGW